VVSVGAGVLPVVAFEDSPPLFAPPPQPATNASVAASARSARRAATNAVRVEARDVRAFRTGGMRGTLAPSCGGGNRRGCGAPRATGGARLASRFDHNRKGSRGSSCLDSDCLFPREQGATGMNSAVLTASLTGRIQFFYYVALLRTSSTSAATTDSWCVHPPFSELLPRCFTGHLPGSASRREIEGSEPPGAIPRPIRPHPHPGRCPTS
jgi:hypothetical protein